MKANYSNDFINLFEDQMILLCSQDLYIIEMNVPVV